MGTISKERLSQSPYFDDYDESKGFSQVLAVPGRTIQAREFTQIQTLIMEHMRRLSETILKDGNIVAGMSYTLRGNALTVHPGRIYLNGLVHVFGGGTIQLDLEGTEKIGIRLDQQIVTDEQDESLRDPALGSSNYMQPGSHRIKNILTLVKNDDTAATLYIFVDGLLYLDNYKPELDVVSDLVARRLYDQSGHYKITGFEMYSKPKDENNITLVVESGKAYVSGYEVNKPSPSFITIPKALETREVIGEIKTFKTGTNKYQLNSDYLNKISRITATLQVTETLTKGAANTMDLLSKSPVSSIVSVTQSGTTYKPSSDYVLSGNMISWAPPGAEPVSGTSYQVTYRYSKVLEITTDYTISNSGSAYYINLQPSLNVVNDSSISIDYTYFLARKDRVYLNQDGDIYIVKGTSDISLLCKAPADAETYSLSLGIITHSPTSSNTVVDTIVVSRSSMKDISLLMQRVDNLEYNMAMEDLDNEAMEGESATNLKGIFTDGFLGLTKCDLGRSDFSVAIDPYSNRMQLQSNTTANKLVVNTGTSTCKIYSGKLAMGAHTTETVLSQNMATGIMNINPYQVFDSYPKIRISPEVDNWIDEENVLINNNKTVSKTIVSGRVFDAYTTTNTEETGRTTVVKDEVISYARPIDITIEGYDFLPNTDILGCTIDGVAVSLTPLNGTAAGSNHGTIRSKADGTLSAKFTLPSGIRAGSREIKLSNPISSASAIFKSNGINRTITTNVFSTTTVTRHVDPLAQSFVLDDSRILTGVTLYFASKDTTDSVTVQVRNMVNGYPGTSVLTEITLRPHQINTSANASIPTRVVFDTPAYCEGGVEYCFVLLTKSNNYNVYIATLSKKLIDSNNFMLKQPYTEGVLFMSSNANTWTAVQESDMKFSLQCARFSRQSVLEFNNISGMNYDALGLITDQVVLPGTSVTWEYQMNGGGWLPITPLTIRDLSSKGTSLKVRAVLVCSDYLSTAIDVQSALAISILTSNSGNYVSRRVDTPQMYTNVKIIYEAYLPSGSALNLLISTNDSTWVSPTLSGTETLGTGLVRKTFTYTIPASGESNMYRVKLALSTSSSLVKPYVTKLLNILK